MSKLIYFLSSRGHAASLWGAGGCTQANMLLDRLWFVWPHCPEQGIQFYAPINVKPLGGEAGHRWRI